MLINAKLVADGGDDALCGRGLMIAEVVSEDDGGGDGQDEKEGG